ncbi:hypothetical protein IFT73_06425 [Aeromicrobium sp. CFBP 8757]|uniref:hypothetical protein n=1 Tax=Aeromicrobium sp. CFBP 8757 TaxID=2775288 RepID=UPI0017807D2C|nr:hypothetical protein [Aeromicrobium sp. CFBP 8757]MBD8606484.1 hypothetical protein [Aeromicrobium sp. CFBP 8757]
MRAEVEVRSTGSRRALDATSVVLCVLVDAAVAFAVVESPFGTIFILDDDPPDGYVLAPLLAGMVIGALQRIAVGTSTTVVAAVIAALGGVATLFFVFPAGVVAVGCVLGAVAATGVRRRMRRRSVLAAIVLVVTGTIAAGYGLTRPQPADMPLLDVTAVPGAPSLVVDPQRRAHGQQLSGVLIDVDGCLGLAVNSVEGRRFVVAWERGTSVSARPYVLDLAGRSYRLGDRVTLPGAAYITLSKDLAGYAPDLPRSCRGTDLILAG